MNEHQLRGHKLSRRILVVARWLVVLLVAVVMFSALPNVQAAQVKPWDEAVAASPALRFETLQGGRYDVSALAGKVAVVNFWAVWCAPCREELPALSRLADSLGGQGVEVLLVNTGDTNSAIEKFFSKLPHPMRTARLPSDKTDFRFAALPATVIFDVHSRPRWVVQGVVDAQGEPVRSLVARLQAEGRTRAQAGAPAAGGSVQLARVAAP